MKLVARLPAALLVVAFLASASAPCPPSTALTTAIAGGAASLTHGSHEEADAGPRLTAPCPCSCSKHAAGAPSAARLGFALLRAPTSVERPVVHAPLATAEPRPPPAPVLELDPVPI